ncbi:DNA-directed RNA polymerases IV and V subunit 2-like [Impatiens glandulifera]|uniref:DNA-directed RNA polymerases IV and V subunit 2-like n=1 Tax=Impatiens glandulifera TaxID=253017 RepID=UPI001FB06FAC|nr:DNA-directed RNA polymerases IV and V subunit 2-like [Impatiens glandulifera]XP_047325524.1 DNA-directed RNA polymerases IV and V subunit 2-like [Impatiens glandulifera]
MGDSDAFEDLGSFSNGAITIDIADLMDAPGTSSNGGKQSIELDYMNMDESVDDIDMDASINDLSKDFLKNFCKSASRSFFNQYGLISHQINSYNDFIDNGVQNVFDSIGEIIVEPSYEPSQKGEDRKFVLIKFGKVRLDRPCFGTGHKFVNVGGREFLDLFPRHARLQNMTYASRMRVDVHIEVYTSRVVKSDKCKTGKEQCLDKHIQFQDDKEITIGRLPVMVRSKLCWMNGAEKGDCDFDYGGYFIVKGAEKAFIAQEQVCLKRLWVSSNPNWAVAYRETSKMRRVYIKLIEPPEIEPLVVKGGGDMLLTVYFFVTEFPIWILFFALGVSSDKEVISLIDCDIEDTRIANILLESIYDADSKCDGFRKGRNALNYIDKLIKNCKFPPKETLEEFFNNNLFPSVCGMKQKAQFLGYMVKCLFQGYIGMRKVDNRDEFRNKRLELAGELLERELGIHIKHAQRLMVKAMQRDLYPERKLQPLEHYLDSSVISNGLARAFSTGAWVHPFKKMERVSGVVANLRRTNPLQTMADMRKTRQQVSYTGRVGDARYPNPSHWGKLCFMSTPDGEHCGLIKNLAVTGLVSTNIIGESLERMLYDCGLETLTDDTSISFSEKCRVFLNGNWVGFCRDSAWFTANFRERRRGKEVPHQVEIKEDKQQKEVRVFSDAGRVLRPLLVVKNLKKIKSLINNKYTFQTLLDNGIVEFIGSEEEEDCLTAWGIEYLFVVGKDDEPGITYTHCELDMSFVLGLSCSIIPFANHDHAKRVLYQSEKHSQQAIGFSTTNPDIRLDTNIHQLYYPQRPLFRTMLSDCLGKLGHPMSQQSRPEFHNGQCAIVAVNVHLGYNQEDSLVMNRASLERGMFRSEHFRNYKADIDNKESTGKRPRFDDCVMFGKMESRFGRVVSLDDDGLPFIGADLKNGDIVIGKRTESGRDRSIKLKHTERGVVQKVVLSANDEGKSFAAVTLRQVRSPCLGDKFSSMHGQKGVLGFVESQENFPFTIEGIVPDIIINPHAFPSRQTPGQLLEAALAKGIALGGQLRSATPFSTLSVNDIIEQLHSGGFCRWGTEKVCCGLSGEMVRPLIFIGPTMYQRLTHMAEDKVKFRNTGPVHPFTRQPVSDRKRFGGIKFGEMERDCLIAHGSSANLHERLFTLSDSSQMHVCGKCNNPANLVQRAVPGAGRKARAPYCRFCKSVEHVMQVDVPFGTKLLCQELFSMGISLKFQISPC